MKRWTTKYLNCFWRRKAGSAVNFTEFCQGVVDSQTLTSRNVWLRRFFSLHLIVRRERLKQQQQNTPRNLFQDVLLGDLLQEFSYIVCTCQFSPSSEWWHQAQEDLNALLRKRRGCRGLNSFPTLIIKKNTSLVNTQSTGNVTSPLSPYWSLDGLPLEPKI